MKKFLFILPLLLAAAPLKSYRGKVISCHDGDTITVQISLGLDITKEETIRLLGIDCHELSTQKGREAKLYVSKLLMGKMIEIQTVNDKREKYGRLLATVILDGTNLTQHLIEIGYGKKYDGGAR